MVPGFGSSLGSFQRKNSGSPSVLPPPVTSGFDSSSSISDFAKPKKNKDNKKAAKAAKAVSDKVKINMGNERTFTKWLAMGMQIGAIGTFVLLMLDSNHVGKSAWGVTTFLVAWAVGFALTLYGVLGYYGRRKAMETGDLDNDPAFKFSWVPLAVTVALVSVVIASLLYVGIVGLPGRSTSSVVIPRK